MASSGTVWVEQRSSSAPCRHGAHRRDRHAAVWEIGALNTTTTFSGVIDGTNTAVTKHRDPHPFRRQPYTGTTTVNTGTLKIGYVSALGAIQGE
ncbi:MAG: hypothetical protein U1F77_09180 [Kiritimatiellia bacterium]